MVVIAFVLWHLAPPPVPEGQTLAIATASWRATSGTAALIERGRVVLGPMPVHVGAGGMGVGIGAHGHMAGPVKREGDQRSPAGVFAVGPTWTWPWTSPAWCVDDPRSPDYARIVTLRPGEPRRFASAERMADYRVAVVVEHNPQHVPGRGSCIFLHDGAEPTVGCTAFAPADLDRVLAKLRLGARIVQLPTVHPAAWRRLGLPPPDGWRVAVQMLDR